MAEDYMQTCNMDERTNEEKLRDSAIADAYALLWSVLMPETPGDHAKLFVKPGKAISEARKLLLPLLTDQERSMAIARLRNKLTNGEYAPHIR